MFHLLIIRTASIDILSTEKCKATFDLKYIKDSKFNLHSIQNKQGYIAETCNINNQHTKT